MIELVNLTKRYKKHKREKIAVNNISTKFPDTGMYFITGKSGSGKSTILSILSGIDFSFEGDMLVDGKSIKSFTRNEINYYRSSYVGYVFQDYNLMTELTAFENVELGADVSGNDHKEEIHEVFKKLDISDLEERKINELSGGETQRVAIARCLIKHPKIILADEPTGALDKENSKIIMDTLALIAKDCLVIIVTHDEDFATMYDCKRIILANGEITNKVDEEVQSSRNFEAKKYKGLSKKLISKLGFETLFHKKIGLVFSMIFIVLCAIISSVSTSGILYNENEVFFKEMLKNDYFVVTRMYEYWFSNTSSLPFTDDLIAKFESYDSNIVYAYQNTDLALDNSSLTDYYLNRPNINYTFQECSGLGFKYEAKTLDVFELSLVEGTAPVNNDEIVISDLIADYFVELEYSYDGVNKIIESYEDLLGLKLYGYTIAGIVTSPKSDEYRKIYAKLKYDLAMYGSYEENSYCYYAGISNAVYYAKNLYQNAEVLVSHNATGSSEYYSDECVLGNNSIITLRNDNIENITYLDGYNSNSKGTIANINYYCNVNGSSYESSRNYYFNHFKYLPAYVGYTDEELYTLADETILAEALAYFSGNTIKYKIDSTMNDDSRNANYVIQNIIGVSFDPSSASNLYLDYSDLEGLETDIVTTNNVESLFSKVKDTDKCREYVYMLLDAKKSENSMKDYALSNEIIATYLDSRDVFIMLKTVFAILTIVFLAIAFFLIYRHVVDSISYKEKEIGVLKSIGVSELDIFKIFSIQSIFISGITIVVSLILQYLGVYGVNLITSSIYGNYIASYDVSFINWILIIAISIIVPLIASLNPIVKCAKKNPKDILNNN